MLKHFSILLLLISGLLVSACDQLSNSGTGLSEGKFDGNWMIDIETSRERNENTYAKKAVENFGRAVELISISNDSSVIGSGSDAANCTVTAIEQSDALTESGVLDCQDINGIHAEFFVSLSGDRNEMTLSPKDMPLIIVYKK
jgi:hypothetical protein